MVEFIHKIQLKCKFFEHTKKRSNRTSYNTNFSYIELDRGLKNLATCVLLTMNFQKMRNLLTALLLPIAFAQDDVQVDCTPDHMEIRVTKGNVHYTGTKRSFNTF